MTQGKIETPLTPTRRPGFGVFYREHFLDEHRHPGTIALHVLGVVASAVWLVGSLLSPAPWLALAYPVVHAVPGLIGHRLFERNTAVGDLRVTRTDFPGLWFILANHVLVLDLLRGGPQRSKG